ncbi:MAG: hypothetical protein ACYDA6_03015 [Solirubrobacteraceae bacterium]
MSLIKHRSRRATAGAVVIVLALAGGGAFAYFTVSGEGSGSAKVETPATGLEVTSLPVELLAPGVSKVQKVTIKNSTAGSVRVHELKASIKGNTNQAAVPPCENTWFTVTPGTTTIGGAEGLELAAGATTEKSVTVTMLNAEVSQNACKGTTVEVHYAAQ